MADDNSISFWWVVVFLVLALSLGAGAVLFVGGDLTGGFLVGLPG